MSQRPDALKRIEELLDAMETCHMCGGVLSLDDVEPTHCENCSGDCDGHDEPKCVPLYFLHSQAKRALRLLKKELREETHENT